MADEITLEQDVDEVLGIVEPAEAGVLDGEGSRASVVEPEDEEEESDAGDDED